jgi:ketosteroid isomerase-like protein
MNLRLLHALGIVCGVFGFGTGGENVATTNENLAKLIRNSADANSALVRGDIDGYLELIKHAEDYTLMSPFGGVPRRGFDASDESRKAMARFFKSGTLDQELVATYNSDNLIVLVTIEHMNGEIGDLPKQDWSLRVTQVYRREGSEWQLVHRHADPLANGISVEEAAKLARGKEPKK